MQRFFENVNALLLIVLIFLEIRFKLISISDYYDLVLEPYLGYFFEKISRLFTQNIAYFDLAGGGKRLR